MGYYLLLCPPGGGPGFRSILVLVYYILYTGCCILDDVWYTVYGIWYIYCAVPNVTVAASGLRMHACDNKQSETLPYLGNITYITYLHYLPTLPIYILYILYYCRICGI